MKLTQHLITGALRRHGVPSALPTDYYRPPTYKTAYGNLGFSLELCRRLSYDTNQIQQIMRPSLLLVIFLLLLFTPGLSKAQDTPTPEEKARAQQFLSTKRLAHAARKAWKVARKEAKKSYPNMPKALNGPLVIDAGSLERATRDFANKTFDQAALMKDFRPMMRGKQVKTGNQRPENGVRIALSGHNGIVKTKTGYKLKFYISYNNAENKTPDSYVQYDTDIVWLHFEQRKGKWRVTCTEVGVVTY